MEKDSNEQRGLEKVLGGLHLRRVSDQLMKTAALKAFKFNLI